MLRMFMETLFIIVKPGNNTDVHQTISYLYKTLLFRIERIELLIYTNGWLSFLFLCGKRKCWTQNNIWWPQSDHTVVVEKEL